MDSCVLEAEKSLDLQLVNWRLNSARGGRSRQSQKAGDHQGPTQ